MPATANPAMTITELKSLLTSHQSELHKSIEAKASSDSVNKLQQQVDAIDLQLAHKLISEKGTGSTLVKTFQENEALHRLVRDKKGSATVHIKGRDVADLLERKSIITAITSGTSEGDLLAPVGVATTGVLPIQRVPGITPEARQSLKVRDLFSSRPTQMQIVDFVRVAMPLSIASPVPEASLKPENALMFVSASERVKLLATWIPATKQILDDMTELMGFLMSSLPYYVDLAEELGLLLGDGVGEDLHGVTPQASTFNAALLPSAQTGYNKIDLIATAISQIAAAKEIPPTFVVMNPVDWWNIKLTKDGFGRYLINPDPQASVSQSLFGLDVVPTTSMPLGQFLVGNGSPVSAEIRDRQDIQIDVSTEHQDYFTRNLVAVRAEKRLAMLVKRPASFVQGQFVTSPTSNL